MRRAIGQVAAAIALAFLLVGPFFLAHRNASIPSGSDLKRVSNTHDMPQHFAVMLQYHLASRDGAIYPRWQSEFNKGYGLPWLNYYPPGFYMLCEPFLRLLRDGIAAFFVVSMVSMMLSGVTFYRFTRLLFDRSGSTAGAALYMIAPYHNIDLYWRGAMPEYTSFFLLPLVALFAWRTTTRGRIRDIALLGLSFGAYALIHVVTGYLVALTIVALVVVRTFRDRDVRGGARCAAGMAIGVAIGAAYWVPALVEKTLVREPFSVFYPYHSSYVTMSPGDEFLKTLNLCFAATLLTFIVCAFVLRGRSAPWFEWAAGAALFMVTPYSVYASRLIPAINSVSFAWRWLLIGTFFVSLMLSAAVERVDKRWYAAAALAVGVLVCARVDLRMMRDAVKNSLLDAPIAQSSVGFVPRAAAEAGDLPYTPNALVRNGLGSADVERWRPLHRVVHVQTETPAQLRIKTFAFAGWIAHVDGAPAAITPDSYGAQVVAVPPGSHRVAFDFENTKARGLADALSIAGIFVAVFLLVAQRWSKTSTES